MAQKMVVIDSDNDDDCDDDGDDDDGVDDDHQIVLWIFTLYADSSWQLQIVFQSPPLSTQGYPF